MHTYRRLAAKLELFDTSDGLLPQMPNGQASAAGFAAPSAAAVLDDSTDELLRFASFAGRSRFIVGPSCDRQHF